MRRSSAAAFQRAYRRRFASPTKRETSLRWRMTPASSIRRTARPPSSPSSRNGRPKHPAARARSPTSRTRFKSCSPRARAGTMGEAYHFPLRIVDGLRLERSLREALLPGRVLYDDAGHPHTLPRYFYEVPSWEHAMNIQLSPSFALWELIQTDVREAAPLRGFPRFVPCAITTLALCLERFRESVG